MTEVWRPVEAFPDYEVSSRGRVRSWRGWGGKRLAAPRLLRPVLNHDGYPVVSLVGTDGRRQRFVHRLVASAFIGPVPISRCVAHGNGIRTDARVENLRYATAAENEADKLIHGTHLANERHPNARLNDQTVRAIRAEYDQGATQTSLARKYGTHQTNVSLIVRGVTRKKVS